MKIHGRWKIGDGRWKTEDSIEEDTWNSLMHSTLKQERSVFHDMNITANDPYQ